MRRNLIIIWSCAILSGLTRWTGFLVISRLMKILFFDCSRKNSVQWLLHVVSGISANSPDLTSLSHNAIILLFPPWKSWPGYRVRTVLESLNFRGSPWNVFKCLCKSLKSPWIFFNFERGGLVSLSNIAVLSSFALSMLILLFRLSI